MNKRLTAMILAALTLAAALAAATDASPNQPAAHAKIVRIGTVDAPSVALAYFRSAQQGVSLKALTVQRDQAQAAGDNKRVKELNSQGEALQELAHKQVFEGKHLNKLKTLMAAIWPKVAASAGVDAVVFDAMYVPDGGEVVDVTEATLKELGADEKTRKLIAEMRAKRVKEDGE